MNKAESVSTNPLRNSVMYELYTQSFLDTNRDGFGDLNGVAQRLDYIKDLGVDTVWFTPIFSSPFAENGYDVSDYRHIDKRYGTNEEFFGLVDKMHHSGIKVFIDLVANHSSSEHEWFRESASSRDNPKSDWYIWRDPLSAGLPPNNWTGNFGGAAWTYREERGQYYLHSFLPEQPDLNYDNPEVIEAMLTTMRFWLDRGVDGIRLDAPAFLAKHPDLLDEPENPDYQPGIDHPNKKLFHIYSQFQPEMLSRIKAFSDVIEKEYPGRFLISESWPGTEADDVFIEKLVKLTSGHIHAPLNSGLIDIPWTKNDIASFTRHFYSLLRDEDIAVWTLGNHDVPRLIKRIGIENARIAAMLLLTLPQSMPVIYQGDELGMMSDNLAPTNRFNVFRRFERETKRTKEPYRQPLPWDESENAGFTQGTAWISVPQNYETNNIKSQSEDETSLLNLYKKLIRHRRNSRAICDGRYAEIRVENNEAYAYEAATTNEKEVIVLNFSSDKQSVSFPYQNAQRVLDTTLRQNHEESDLSNLTLLPHQGVIFAIESS